MVQLKHMPPHTAWASTTGIHLVGSYYFDAPINTTSYAQMADMCLIPELRQRTHGKCGAAAQSSTCTFCRQCVQCFE